MMKKHLSTVNHPDHKDSLLLHSVCETLREQRIWIKEKEEHNDYPLCQLGMFLREAKSIHSFYHKEERMDTGIYENKKSPAEMLAHLKRVKQINSHT